MRLESIKYSENEGTPQEWRLETLTLGSLNLLVSKNAIGKTRTLNLINGLAKLVSGEIKAVFISGDYDARFDHKGEKIRYVLHYRDSQVIREEFHRGGEILLKRGRGGQGKILAKGMRRRIPFQTPSNELAVVTRRDNIQHPFFEPLYDWGNSLRYFEFGGTLGKRTITNLLPQEPQEEKTEPAPTSTEQVLSVFKLGERKYGATFKRFIMGYMAEIGYPLKQIAISRPVSLMVKGSLAGEPGFLTVKEKGLRGITDQNIMSQGMFRALSVIIQLTYSQLARKRSCILIDDIGEGLDYDRSCALIQLLSKRFHKSFAQIIMSTNDRFVMNTVPLESWTVLYRRGNSVKGYNYSNSRKYFDAFKFTGMNNFDFFATDYLQQKHRAS